MSAGIMCTILASQDLFLHPLPRTHMYIPPCAKSNPEQLEDVRIYIYTLTKSPIKKLNTRGVAVSHGRWFLPCRPSKIQMGVM